MKGASPLRSAPRHHPGGLGGGDQVLERVQDDARGRRARAGPDRAQQEATEEDQEHVRLCAEFPSLSWLAATPEKALAGIRKLVKETLTDMESNGEPEPEPIALKSFWMKSILIRSLSIVTRMNFRGGKDNALILRAHFL